ncbi:MAG: M23 family metallopeptidase [Alistipes sp.]|nr:M23 family metallopeptidase [Rikenellaceae bacterium]MBQ4540911.1 M23 family metallopeptidase [Alistipes sp.]MBR3794034.1 M23 family metallopeptidase [Alistipes sp.]MBR7116061.1 M23 family metallopeptidase [Alistipes sp.]MDO5487423.1 M23 family metallopeptidase [Rikenellaceae bacterium]
MRRFSIKHNGQEEVQSLIHRLRSYRLVRNLLIGFILVAICNLLFSSLFYTPKMFRLADERRALKLKYEILENRIASAQRQLEQIRHRDNFVYRPLFSSDTLSIDGVYDRYADSKYASIEGNDYSPVMKRMWQQMDQLARSLYLESKSMDELQILSEDKERFSTSVPAIWPIDRSKLRNKIGAFGYRNHPVLRRWKFHSGVDMPGRVGDPIYATGDGVVEYVERSRARYGYGTQILIDHGYGYKTRYAHLNKLLVEKGDTITRGQLIAEMGNTGISTAPHLHYEVIYNRTHVNPINYFDQNMSAEAYKSLMGQIQDANYEAE